MPGLKTQHLSRLLFCKNNNYVYVSGRTLYNHCIPYNDDTKHLVGTTDEAPEYYRYCGSRLTLSGILNDALHLTQSLTVYQQWF